MKEIEENLDLLEIEEEAEKNEEEEQPDPTSLRDPRRPGHSW